MAENDAAPVQGQAARRLRLPLLLVLLACSAVLALAGAFALSWVAEQPAGTTRTALFCAVAAVLAFAGALLVAALLVRPMRRVARAIDAVAAGDLGQQVAGSRLAEMDGLAQAFNRMAAHLQGSFQRLERSEKIVSGIFGATPVAMAVFETESLLPTAADLRRGRTVVQVNEAWARLFGHAREYALGKSSSQLGFWANWDDRQTFVTAMYQDGGISGFSAPLLRADSSRFEGLVSGRDVVVADQRLSIVAFEDVTHLRETALQLQGLNRQLNALLDAALEVAIVATDPAGLITVFNRGAERMLGFSAAEMLGQSAQWLHLPDDLAARTLEISPRPEGTPNIAALYAGLTGSDGSAIRNWIFVRRDGQPVQVSMALSAMRDEAGSTLGYLGIARDISEQMAAQAEMIELNASLDRRVRERTQALEEALTHLRQMQAKLVQSEKLASLATVVAAVAHELNTPIGNARTVASTLQADAVTLQAEFAAGALRKRRMEEFLGNLLPATSLVERALDQASNLVANFKRVAVDQSSENRRVFDLRATLNETLALHAPTLRRTPYRMEMDVPEGILLESYPGALGQVLTNLINNALMHGFAGRSQGLMRLSASLEPGLPGVVRLSFSDDGAGMSADTQARIYDPFFTTALGRGGSGLGMHISYNLVTGPLGGEIELHSALGQGSRFIITLPLRAREDTGATSAPSGLRG